MSIQPLDAAEAFVDAGLSVIPIRDGKSKAPATQWKKYQSEIADEAQIKRWFTDKYSRMAIACGSVSGGLEVMDFDHETAFPRFKEVAEKHCPGLVDTLPVIKTPSGGAHLYYRCGKAVGNNDKLAWMRDGPDEKIYIETRGEGGYVLCPPSEGYEFLGGTKLTAGVPIIHESERSLLFAVAKSLQNFVDPKTDNDFVVTKGESTKPGDEFNERGWPECSTMLTAAGWKLLRKRATGTEEWKRPGKKDEGISATYGHIDNRFYVFSSNASPFNSMETYTPFGVFTTIGFDGDYTAAAAALVAKGYGAMRLAKAAGAEGAAVHQEEENEANRFLPYGLEGNRIVYYGARQNQFNVADFRAEIVEQKYGEHDDTYYEVSGSTIYGRKFSCEIRADHFEDPKQLKMSIGAAAGPNAAIYRGMSGHLSAAIKKLSKLDVKISKRYVRTGWAGKRFLMPGLPVEGAKIEPLHIPFGVNEKADLSEALVGLEGLILSHGPQIGTIVVAHMLAPPLIKLSGVQARYALHLTGLSGSLKTSFAQAAMTIWGEGFARESTIIQWGQGATPNALISLASEAVDMPFMIDNYKPNVGRGGLDFIGFIHAAVEGGEKWRSAQSGMIRSDHRELHCWPFTTGEDIVDSDAASIARMLILDFGSSNKGQNENLRAAQTRSSDMNAIGREWIKYLESDDGKKLATLLSERFAIIQEHWSAILIKKIEDTVNVLRIANNLAACQLTYQVACECGAFGEVLKKYEEHLAPALMGLLGKMGFYSVESREVYRFFEGLKEALASGDAVLDEFGVMDESTRKELKLMDRGRMIGWHNELDQIVYLLPKKSQQIASRVLDEPLAITTTNLGKQMTAVGAILMNEPGRTTKKKRIGNALHRVWFVKDYMIFGEKDEGVTV